MDNNTTEKESVRKRAKRAVALMAAVLLGLMYILTFLFAVFDNPQTMNLFKASLVMTIVMPVFLYAYQLVYRVISNQGEKTIHNKDLK